MGESRADVKRVLLITYHFPPEGGPGTQRSAKFAKYLSSFGWDPIVLTRAAGKDGDEWHSEDHTLFDELGQNLEVHRVLAGSEPRGWAAQVSPIDVARDWLEPAADAAMQIIKRTPVDAVLVSMSPFDLSYLGLQIRERTGVPVVFDLRDPWALDGWRLRGNWFRWRRDWNAMRETLSAADGVIANTSDARRVFLQQFRTLRDENVIAIPNGFDESDFERVATKQLTSTDLVRICHIGTLHCGELYRYEGLLGSLKRLKHYRPEPIDPTGRTPKYLLKAIRLLREKGDKRVEKLRVRLIGPIDAETRRCVEESGVSDLVEIVGYVTHHQAVEELVQADILFAPLHGLPEGRRSLIVPGKIYEYLRSGRPIVGCLPDGEARELVERAGGECADPCDEAQIASAIQRLLDGKKLARHEQFPQPEWIKSYERRELTAQLGRFLDKVAGGAVVSESPRSQPKHHAALSAT
jgi:glycosyltransferase involved in cell wall biosynthesis